MPSRDTTGTRTSYSTQRRAYLKAIGAGAVATGIAGCLGNLTGTENGGGEGPLKIGVVQPYSGDLSEFGAPMENGQKLAVQHITTPAA